MSTKKKPKKPRAPKLPATVEALAMKISWTVGFGRDIDGRPVMWIQGPPRMTPVVPIRGGRGRGKEKTNG